MEQRTLADMSLFGNKKRSKRNFRKKAAVSEEDLEEGKDGISVVDGKEGANGPKHGTEGHDPSPSLVVSNPTDNR